MQCQVQRSGTLPSRRRRRWLSKRQHPDPHRSGADPGNRWPRSNTYRAIPAGRNFGRARCSYSRSIRRPRTGPTHIRWPLRRAVRSPVCRRSQWSRRHWLSAYTGIRRHSQRPSSPTRTCPEDKDRVSNSRVGSRGRYPCHHTSGASSRPALSKKMSRMGCPPRTACTSQSHRTTQCCHRSCDRLPGKQGQTSRRG